MGSWSPSTDARTIYRESVKHAISMPVRDGSRQKKNSCIHEIEQGIASFSDEKFAMIKRFVERRSRDAAQVTVTPVDTVQYCSSRSPSSEMPFDTRAHIIWRKRTRV